jgi:hypothetical protein
MAYDFNGTNNCLSTASAPVLSVPLSMACWFKTSSTTANQIILALENSSGPSVGYRIGALGGITGDPFRADVLGTNLGSITSDIFNFNTDWNHGCGVFTETSVVASLNGTSSTTNTNVSTFPTINRLDIAARLASGTLGAFFVGLIAEVGIWNAALTAAEIASLAKGMTCDKVRPQNLVFYAPLVRQLLDAKGGLTITNNGATVANHPRVYA